MDLKHKYGDGYNLIVERVSTSNEMEHSQQQQESKVNSNKLFKAYCRNVSTNTFHYFFSGTYLKKVLGSEYPMWLLRKFSVIILTQKPHLSIQCSMFTKQILV